MNPEPNLRNRRRILGIAAVALLIAVAWPTRYLASPRWEVWVVKDDGQPIPQVNVRLVYQNYSAEGESHEVTLKTDANGRVLFTQHHERACILQRLLYTTSSAMAGVHESFGRHAHVFAFGNGYEGTAMIGNYVADWRGNPDSMQSKIVANHSRI
jgi:hypothetical protein